MHLDGATVVKELSTAGVEPLTIPKQGLLLIFSEYRVSKRDLPPYNSLTDSRALGLAVTQECGVDAQDARSKKDASTRGGEGIPCACL